MEFSYASPICADFPELTAGALFARGVELDARLARESASVRPLYATARRRLADATEAELDEIRAWRRAFARMGLKPTQYRCAAESLLRRFRREGTLPAIYPLVDLCNAVSLGYAIPVAAFDVAKLTGDLQVRYATGTERYVAFSGVIEHPAPGEVIFADSAGNAHARRWTHRQSALSAVAGTTGAVLVVAEAMHDSGEADIGSLVATVTEAVADLWPRATVTTAFLSARRHVRRATLS